MAEGYIVTVCLLLAQMCVFRTVTCHVVSACFSSSNKSLDVDCGAGYMVHITKTFYGFSPSGQCRRLDSEAGTGCTFDDQTRYPCIGHRTCSINLPTGQLGVNVPACGQRSNYFQMEYTCVLASSVSDICRTGEITAQYGYIKTPSYPANYKEQDDCSTKIVVNPNQKLNLNIIDMQLEELNKTDCTDLLYLNDKLRSITLCGQRNNGSYSMHTNYLFIELQSRSWGRSKGFWLYYEAVPPLPSTQKSPVTPAVPSDDMDQAAKVKYDPGKGSNSVLTTTSSRMYSNNTVFLYHKVKGSGKQLPFGAIAGGVIGTLSLILLVLLVLLFIKWLRERKHYKGEKILEIRNPAFKSSNDFHEASLANNDFHC
ncbi:hypothetical protein BsWGS_12723 [Bradybaena similaris]